MPAFQPESVMPVLQKALRRRVDTVAVAAASGHVEPVNRTTDKPAKRGNARRWGGIRSRTASAMQPR
jgi:hypothetical protein